MSCLALSGIWRKRTSTEKLVVEDHTTESLRMPRITYVLRYPISVKKIGGAYRRENGWN
jgi:hypothetical protein